MTAIFADRIKETTVTTGTGALTLAGAMTGFRAFSTACSVGDTLFYAVQAVDASGSPTGDWEVGEGTYSGSNTLSRTTVIASSNANAAVNFAAGTKQVWLTHTARQASWQREKLSANRTYYVSTTGADTNDGKSSGAAFLTVQKAIDTVANTLDIPSGITVTIQVADGTYTGSNTLRRFTGGGSVIINGNSSTPTNVVISTTSADCFSAAHGVFGYTLQNLYLNTSSSGNGINANSNAYVLGTNLAFGSIASFGAYAWNGGVVHLYGNITINGGMLGFAVAGMNGMVSAGAAYTFVFTPAISLWFAQATGGTVTLVGSTWTGSFATGKRYDAVANGVINTNGQSTTWIPGAAAGTTATGGQYV